MDRTIELAAWQREQLALCDAIMADGDVLPIATRLFRAVVRAAEEGGMAGFPLALAFELSAKLEQAGEAVLSRSRGVDVNAVRAAVSCVRGAVMDFALPGRVGASERVHYVALLACEIEFAYRQAAVNASGLQLEKDIAMAGPLLVPRAAATPLH